MPDLSFPELTVDEFYRYRFLGVKQLVVRNSTPAGVYIDLGKFTAIGAHWFPRSLIRESFGGLYAPNSYLIKCRIISDDN